MAKDLRDGHLVTAAAGPTPEELTTECKREEETCLYTATSLYIWLRRLRLWQAVFTVLPLIFGTIAGWSVLKEIDDPFAQGVTALCGLLAGLLPAVYNGLKIDGLMEQCKRLAAEYTNLRDAFRQAALISARKPLAEFESEFRPLMKRLEAARKEGVTPPEWSFTAAQKKIQGGHYDPDPPRQG
jgi:hypothetical protein